MVNYGNSPNVARGGLPWVLLCRIQDPVTPWHIHYICLLFVHFTAVDSIPRLLPPELPCNWQTFGFFLCLTRLRCVSDFLLRSQCVFCLVLVVFPIFLWTIDAPEFLLVCIVWLGDVGSTILFPRWQCILPGVFGNTIWLWDKSKHLRADRWSMF